MMKKIGFIGTGGMGSSMCAHILKGGYEISVYNRTKAKAQKILDLGAHWCDNPKIVAENSEIIFTIVGFPRDVDGDRCQADPRTVLLSGRR